jgi:aryl-alcohol dehydrogenase-like predicted oxidoreductase
VEYRRLGDSGPQVSAVGLGTNNFAGRLNDEAARAVLGEALELGVTFVDTADVYGRGSEEGLGASESQLGRLLAERRQDVILATKFGLAMGESVYERGASRGWIVRAAEASLRRLRTDYIDLYQVHTPDPETPIEETLRALDDLVGAGKVRWVGHSNFAAWQIADANWTARTNHLSRPISAQMHYNLLVRNIQAEVIPACQSFGLGVIPYFRSNPGSSRASTDRPEKARAGWPEVRAQPRSSRTPTSRESNGSSVSLPNGSASCSTWLSDGCSASRSSARSSPAPALPIRSRRTSLPPNGV